MTKSASTITGAQVADLRRGGLSMPAIAKRLGCTVAVARFRLEAWQAQTGEIVEPPSGPTPEQIRDLRDRGRTWPQVAAELRCTVATARSRLKQVPGIGGEPAWLGDATRAALAEEDEKEDEDIVHRDLKPDNILVPDLKAARAERERAAREHRRGSDYAPMLPVDFANEFATGVANDTRPGAGATSQQAAAEKRQEFNARMGEFASDFRDAVADAAAGNGQIGDRLPEKHATYITLLAEQERRFGNRRHARSLAIAEAHEQISRQAFMHVAERYFSARVEATGYARERREKPQERTVCLLLSDLHLGSELDSLDEPMAFTAIQEARRLEYVLRQLLDYKPQYRDQSEALVIINGDVIEGQLMHDFRSGSPLAEQKAIFWSYFTAFLALVAQQYPRVRVVCQPGNHGRDKVRHPGRATSRKWDGHEWECYFALRMACSQLRNVEWQIDFHAVSVVDLHGAKLGVTHGDTDVKLGHPDSASAKNAAIFDRVNSTRIYGCEFAAWVVGHFHSPRYQPRKPRVIYNGALVPPNGYARTEGHIAEPCGQFLWEAVEGYPIGDLRFIEVGAAQDNDEKLGTLIKPFRFTD